jgi:hypothetical protein
MCDLQIQQVSKSYLLEADDSFLLSTSNDVSNIYSIAMKQCHETGADSKRLEIEDRSSENASTVEDERRTSYLQKLASKS